MGLGRRFCVEISYWISESAAIPGADCGSGPFFETAQSSKVRFYLLVDLAKPAGAVI